MEVTFDGRKARAAVKTSTAVLIDGFRRLTDEIGTRCVTASGRAMWHCQRGVSKTRSAVSMVSTRAGDPRVRRFGERMWFGVMGRRPDISVGVTLIAPLLALVANYWAGGIGFTRIVSWVHGTWYGTDPQMVVFLAVGLLVGLAAVSATMNSGALPTTILVMGPVFGTAFATYGTEHAYYGTVGIPEAVSIGFFLSVAIGMPIGCTGFVLGTAARRIAKTLRSPDRA